MEPNLVELCNARICIWISLKMCKVEASHFKGP